MKKFKNTESAKLWGFSWRTESCASIYNFFLFHNPLGQLSMFILHFAWSKQQVLSLFDDGLNPSQGYILANST